MSYTNPLKAELMRSYAPGAHEKDKVENYLHRQVCGGQMTLAAAQKQIASDWLSVWDQIKP